MARPWEYPRWRRILMQVAMCVIFGASLGLAHLVVRQRQHMPITLDPRMRLGPLSVQLPQGWMIVSEQDPNADQVQAVDPNQTEELTIQVQRLPEKQSGARNLDQSGAGTQPIYFKGLNQKGVMIALPQKLRTPEGALISGETLRAITDLSHGYEVEIILIQGSGKMGAGERRIVEAVANGITWAGPLPSEKRRAPLPPESVQ